MTRATEVASLLKQARQAEALARKYRRDEEGYERNMDDASRLRLKAQDLLDSKTSSDADFWKDLDRRLRQQGYFR